MDCPLLPKGGRGTVARRRDWLVIGLWAAAACTVGIALFLLMFVLPKFVALFEELGVQEFPLPTMVLMKVSMFLTSSWWLVVLAVVAALVLGGRTAVGRKWRDRLLPGRAKVFAPAVVACLGLVAVPVIALATFLPMLTTFGQLSRP